MIGLFGFSEVLAHTWPGRRIFPNANGAASANQWRFFFRAPLRLIARAKALVARSSFLGILVGLLPGAGADIGAWIACSFQKMTRKTAAQDEQIVLAGASSNNAAVASAWVPALSLGLPGDTVTAMVLAVFYDEGCNAGPYAL